jgi:hypothetical protein
MSKDNHVKKLTCQRTIADNMVANSTRKDSVQRFHEDFDFENKSAPAATSIARQWLSPETRQRSWTWDGDRRFDSEPKSETKSAGELGSLREAPLQTGRQFKHKGYLTQK